MKLKKIKIKKKKKGEIFHTKNFQQKYIYILTVESIRSILGHLLCGSNSMYPHILLIRDASSLLKTCSVSHHSSLH